MAIFLWSCLFSFNISHSWINLLYQVSLPCNYIHHSSSNVDMTDLSVNSPSKYHPLFNWKPLHVGNI